jgi:hypothetical protein
MTGKKAKFVKMKSILRVKKDVRESAARQGVPGRGP